METPTAGKEENMFRLPWRRRKTPRGEQTLDLTNAMGVGGSTLAPDSKANADRIAAKFLSEVATGEDGMITLPITTKSMIGMGERIGVTVAFSDHKPAGDDGTAKAPYVRLAADGNGGMTVDMPSRLSAPVCRRALMMLLVCIYSGDMTKHLDKGDYDIPVSVFNIHATRQGKLRNMMVFADYVSAAIIAPKDFIRTAFLNGWSMRRIGDVLDITFNSVYRLCRKANLDCDDTKAEAWAQVSEEEKHLDGPQTCKWSPLGYLSD